MKLIPFVIVLAFLAGCKTAREEAAEAVKSCIQPPVTGVTGDDKASAEISANLAKLPLDAKLKGEFHRVLKADFGKLNDRNTSLLLFLRAIECYMTKGKVGEDIARDLAKMVREQWSADAGFRGKDGPLTPLERAYIQNSKFSDEILTKLTRQGIN